MNYPAASYGVSEVFRHAGLDPVSSLSFSDSGVRRNDKTAASRAECTQRDSKQIAHSMKLLFVSVISILVI
jgi:hypothetical protein